VTHKQSMLIASGVAIAAAALALTHPTLGVARPALGAHGSRAVVAPRFEVDPLWPKPMPNHWILGSAVGVAVDARDNVYVVNLTDSFSPRSEAGSGTNPPTSDCCTPAPNVLEFSPAGTLVAHWGGKSDGVDWPAENAGIAVDANDNVWIGGGGNTDRGLLELSHTGTLIKQFGQGGAVAAAASAVDTAYASAARGRGRGGRGSGPARIGGAPSERNGCGGGGGSPLDANSAAMDAFGGAVGVSFDTKTNEGFVADGCRNHRVAVIDLGSGAIKRVWGAYGDKPDDAAVTAYHSGDSPKQFSDVTCAERSADGLVYVCDRGNDRIQVFRENGTFVKEKALAPTTLGVGSVWDVAFSRDPQQKYLYVADGMNARVYVLDRQSLDVLTSFGDGGRQPGQFLGVHSLAVDSKGNLYTVEAFEGKRIQKFTFKGVGPVAGPALGTLWPRSGR
jgi:DNA-binding beta-propeller fold protein YncE